MMNKSKYKTGDRLSTWEGFDKLHPLALAAKYPPCPKFWFGDILSLSITSDQIFSVGTVMGLDYQYNDLKTGNPREYFWLYKVQSFHFYGWFSEDRLIKYGNKPTISDRRFNDDTLNDFWTSNES